MQTNFKNKEEITTKLNTLLADLYSLYYKFQVCHWHVKGPHFKPLHEQFEENYTEIATNIDEVAERVVTLGGRAPVSLSEVEKLASIEQKNIDKAEDMVKELVSDNVFVIEKAREIAELAGDSADEATSDLLAPIINAREKATWMLESYLG